MTEVQHHILSGADKGDPVSNFNQHQQCERVDPYFRTADSMLRDWGSIFGDPIIATAILDRLLHHLTTINIRGESYRSKTAVGLDWYRRGNRSASEFPLLGRGLRCAQNAPKSGAGLHCVRGQGASYMNFRGGEFFTGEMGNFQPALTGLLPWPDLR